MVETVMVVLGGVAVLLLLVMVAYNLLGKKQDASAALTTAPKPRPAASVNMRTNWLEGVEGSVQGKTFHIGAREATIGRKVGNYIQLIDDNVSRVHVKVMGSAQGVEVIDQKSNIGTQVNGKALTAGVAHLLQSGDRLTIGKNVFVFHAQANYEVNYGLTEAKVAGQAQHKQTAAMGVINWKQDVADALMQAGGDKVKAAELMGVSPEVFERMLEQAQRQG